MRYLPAKLALKRTDDQLRARFATLQSVADVAALLEVPIAKLTYYAYKNRTYTTFTIPKRRGGGRTISAPANNIKILQMKLNHVLRLVYKNRAAVHGFALGKSIVTNAASHTRRRFVLNVDLRDFFPSINFGRVRGMLMAPPYNLGPGAATVIAQLCTYNGTVPQGAPTSPIITNMICGRLDSQLKKLAASHRCRYTRYADDITISASTRHFPEAIARVDTTAGTGQVVIGDTLQSVIQSNGFTVNPDKVKLSPQRERQEVTGLISNRFPNVPRPYIRQLRGLLHAWERYGIDAAAREFFLRHDPKGRTGGRAELLKIVTRGKIAFIGRVRGDDDPIYLKLLTTFARLNPEFGIKIPDGADLGPGMQDDLLPLLRRRMFNRDLPAAFEQSSVASPLSLLLIDVDHFKSVNDNYGHQIGDEVLIDCSKMIAGRCQGKGDVYRFGGEEIVVLLSNFSQQEAVALAELIRSDIEKARVAGARISVTVSTGVATAPDHAATSDDLVKAADDAMYRAKRAGRNRVQVAGNAT